MTQAMQAVIDAVVCPMCQRAGWACGQPCLRDPSKPAHLFNADGSIKTLKERGLGWDDPPPRLAQAKRKRSKPVLVQLKAMVERKGGPVSVTEPVTVTKKDEVTKKAEAINVTPQAKRGRPSTGKAMTAAERKRLSRAKAKGKPVEFEG